VFMLPDNLAALDVDAAADAGGKVGHGQNGGEQQARPSAGRHHRRTSTTIAVASRDLELIEEDIGSCKIGA
jgi:hypothetical protein